MFKLLGSFVGGTILLLLAIIIAVGVFIDRVRPTTPGGTVGFWPQQLVQTPTIFVPMLVIFTLGFFATYLFLRHR